MVFLRLIHFVCNFSNKILGNGLHLRSKHQVFIISKKDYLTFQSWLLLMGGSFNFHCALGRFNVKRNQNYFTLNNEGGNWDMDELKLVEWNTTK